LLAPEVLAGLSNLELVARTAVDGSLIGLHRSAKFGFSQEFAEYRAYTPGDDLRFIDWNVFARTDRTFVKRFYGDTNTRLVVALDTSGSMAVAASQGASGAVDKLTYGKFTAAALVHLAARQHDAAGVALFADRLVGFHPPETGPRATGRAYHALDDAEAGGATDWPGVMRQLSGRIPNRSLVVLISDLYVTRETFAEGIRQLGVRGHDLLVIHLLSPEDYRPGGGAAVTLRDAESARTIAVDQADLDGAYQARLDEHIAGMRHDVLKSGGHYLQMNTDQPLNETLKRYLNFRARHP
jgi:uncharacterized protein (DUF58 family)